MKKILVTGGAGYIGSVLIPKLLSKNYSVVCLDNFIFTQFTLSECCKYENFKMIHGDVRDKELIKELLKEVEFVIPLAALVGAPLCDKDPFGAQTINADSIGMMNELVSKDHKIIMPVSNSGYGVSTDGKPCTEESPLNPVSLYGITKVKAEKLVMERENSISFRLATVFGFSPRMRLDLLVNDFVYKAFYEKSILIFEGHFKRNYIHIQDVTDAIIYSLENFKKMKSNIFNLGLEEANLSKLELANLIKKFISDFKIVQSEYGKDPDKRNYIVSNKKINDIGFIPSWSLEKGIKELVRGMPLVGKKRFGNI
jgi:nucleoside-diphosphate-sugar epimerase